MKYNITKLISSVIVFCLSVGGVFGYALYGAGKKSAQDQQLNSAVGQTSAPIETTDPDVSSASQSITSPVPARTTSVRPTSVRSNSDDSEGDEHDSEGDDDSRSGFTQTAPVKTVPVPAKPVSNPVATTPVDTRKLTVYKNGTYTAVGSYMSPAGTEQISVTVTLVNDVITNTSAVSMANDRTSERYEQKFIGGYAAQIVGKNIDTVSLSYVSGSSLTPNGFNDALAKIKASARA